MDITEKLKEYSAVRALNLGKAFSEVLGIIYTLKNTLNLQVLKKQSWEMSKLIFLPFFSKMDLKEHEQKGGLGKK